MSTLSWRRDRTIDRSSMVSLAVLLVALLASAAWWSLGPSYRSPGFDFGPPTLGPLPDGRMFALLRDLSPAGAVVDPAMVLTGDAAVSAAIADGVIPPGGTLINDVYVANGVEEVITVPLAANPRLTVLAHDNDGRISPVDITLEQLVTSLEGGYADVAIHRLSAGAFPVILEIQDGVLAGFVQPYLP